MEWLPLSPSGNAYFALLAYDADEFTAAQVSLVINTEAPPPVGLEVSQGGDGAAIHLAWEPLAQTYPEIEFENIIVERGETPAGPWQHIFDLPPQATEFADTWHPDDNPIPYGEPLFYRLCAIVLGQPGPAGNCSSGWRALQAVPELNATDAAHSDRIVLSWVPVPGADGYDLEYRLANDADPLPFEPLEHVAGGTATEFEHTTSYPPGKPAGIMQEYDYRVRATIGPDCCEAWSPEDRGCLNVEPFAVLQVTNGSGPRPLTVQFDGSESYDWDGGDLTFEWDWEGDGTYDLSETTGVVSHTYMLQDTYQATMRVIDDEETTNSAWHLVNVSGWQHSWSMTDEVLAAIAYDADNNIYAAGMTTNAPGVDGDGLILKYSPDGELLWARRWSAEADDWLNDICIDQDGNLHAVGMTASVGAGAWDVLLLKIAPDGTLLWQKTWGTSDLERAMALCCIGSEMAVCGYAWDSGSNDYTGLLLTYNATTGAINWHKSISCNEELAFNDAVNGFGQIVLAGDYMEDSGGGCSTYACSVSLSSGSILNDVVFDGSNFENGADVALNADTGNFFVSGMTNSFSNRYQQIILKFDSTLTLVWAKHVGDPEMYDQPQGIWAEGGSVYTVGAETYDMTYRTSLFELSTAGDLLNQWVIFNEQETSQGGNIAMDPAGWLTVVGYSFSAYQTVAPASVGVFNAPVTYVDPNSTMADMTGTLADQLVTWLSPTGVEDENNNDQNAGYIARLDLSVL
jgi:hypothetical protein